MRVILLSRLEEICYSHGSMLGWLIRILLKRYLFPLNDICSPTSQEFRYALFSFWRLLTIYMDLSFQALELTGISDQHISYRASVTNNNCTFQSQIMHSKENTKTNKTCITITWLPVRPVMTSYRGHHGTSGNAGGPF